MSEIERTVRIIVVNQTDYDIVMVGLVNTPEWLGQGGNLYYKTDKFVDGNPYWDVVLRDTAMIGYASQTSDGDWQFKAPPGKETALFNWVLRSVSPVGQLYASAQLSFLWRNGSGLEPGSDGKAWITWEKSLNESDLRNYPKLVKAGMPFFRAQFNVRQDSGAAMAGSVAVDRYIGTSGIDNKTGLEPYPSPQEPECVRLQSNSYGLLVSGEFVDGPDPVLRLIFKTAATLTHIGDCVRSTSQPGVIPPTKCWQNASEAGKGTVALHQYTDSSPIVGTTHKWLEYRGYTFVNSYWEVELQAVNPGNPNHTMRDGYGKSLKITPDNGIFVFVEPPPPTGTSGAASGATATPVEDIIWKDHYYLCQTGKFLPG